MAATWIKQWGRPKWWWRNDVVQAMDRWFWRRICAMTYLGPITKLGMEKWYQQYKSCTIAFKKNGPPTNYKVQIHNIAHARLLEALVHKITQRNHTNMLYFEIKYVIEWNEWFVLAASMPLKIEITIKVIYTEFIETGYKIYRNMMNKKAK